jgi:2'-5' RNA ligase
VRAFFAVNLASEVRGRIGEVEESLRSTLRGEPIGWVRPEILHLTLRFLGETPHDQLEAVRQAAENAARTWSAFRLALRGLGCFPEARRPRVIWVGVSEPSGALARIASDLESIARSSGFKPETREFRPHLTLGRVRDRLSPEGLGALSAALKAHAQTDFGVSFVDAVHLMRSQLRPAGPEYTPIVALALSPDREEAVSP